MATLLASAVTGGSLNALSAMILGIVEGLTEFLPISSTGHLILAEALMKMQSTDALKSFSVAIQLGAILAVVILYGKRIILSRRTFLLTLAGFAPTGIIGFLLHGIVRTYLLGNVTVVAWSLTIGGLLLIAFERWYREPQRALTSIEGMTLWQAMVIGCCQSIAIVPGVSRAAATIVGGLALGLKRRTIVEFSFLLAIPTMLAATALDLLKTATVMTGTDFEFIGIGFLTSFVIALLAVRWFLSYIQRHSFTAFGAYRIVVGVLCLWLL